MPEGNSDQYCSSVCWEGTRGPRPSSCRRRRKRTEKSFCAGIGTEHTIFDLSKGNQLVITFMVFNDGRIGVIHTTRNPSC